MVTDVEMVAMQELIFLCKDKNTKKILEIAQDMLGDLPGDGFRTAAELMAFLDRFAGEINDLTITVEKTSIPTSRATQAQALVDGVKDNYQKLNLEGAWTCWTGIYDLFEPKEHMSSEDRLALFQEQQKYLGQIDDNVVFAVTDYGRDKYYRGDCCLDARIAEAQSERTFKNVSDADAVSMKIERE